MKKAVITIVRNKSQIGGYDGVCNPPTGRAYGSSFGDPADAAAWAVQRGLSYASGYVIIAPELVTNHIPQDLRTA